MRLTVLFALAVALAAGEAPSLKLGGAEAIVDGTPKVVAAVAERSSVSEGKTTISYGPHDVATPKESWEGRTRTLAFAWGSVAIATAPAADRLDLAVTVANRSQEVLADVDLALLRFAAAPPETDKKGKPAKPKAQSAYGLDNVAAVTVRLAGGTLVAAVAPGEQPDRLALEPQDDGTQLLSLRGRVAALDPDLLHLQPRGKPRLAAGASRTVNLTLRVVPEGTPRDAVIADLYAAYSKLHPPSVVWPDRRPIGMLMFQGDRLGEANPRGWFKDKKLDIRTPEGKASLRKQLEAWSDRSVAMLKKMNAQGAVLWNSEGEENPHPISYIGDPRMLATMAPEMDEIIDLHHAKMIAAGLRTGICIRPTEVWFDAEKKKWNRSAGNDGVRGEPKHAAQKPKDLENWQYFPVVERLAQMIELAQKRWQATIFYIDTNGVYRPWGDEQKFEFVLMESAMLAELNRRFPGILLIPELPRSNTGTYHAAYALHGAQYGELDMGQRGLPNWIRRMHPTAFGVTVMSDGDFAANRAELLENVKRGDVLMVHGWWWPKRNDEVLALYEEAFPGFSTQGAKAAQFPGK